jgi:hypothetical protein
VNTRYLVVANKTLGGRQLISTIVGHAREGADIHVTVPATPLDAAEEAAGARGAVIVAEERLGEALRRLTEAGVEATGNIGPADPLAAIREQLAGTRFSGLIISTLPRHVSRWLHLDLPHRAVREFALPVEWLESAGDDAAAVVHIEVPASANRNLVGPNMAKQDLPPFRNR